MGEALAVLALKPKDSHRQASDRARHAIAIKIESFEGWRADVLESIHFHAVDNGEKVFAREVERVDRQCERGHERTGMSFIQCVDLVPPLIELRESFRPRIIGIRDIVHAPAKTVDLVHRIALRLRQYPHRGIERTAGRALRRGSGACGVHSTAHALRGLCDADRMRARRPRAPPDSPISATAATPGVLR